ncbi:hypothetical protein [Nocardia sp. XZ_19_385]|uniref:hypothetical protein n=1 Tax=Nocardia sp. XZ_19_385 TaxID=2769488 RepID=UPI00188FE5FE|nr:hypothetical protein [Nocardia sp. XZ_19_385]
MNPNENEPILPAPSDLYRRMAKFYNHIDQMRDELGRLTGEYADLAHSPESLAVDNLGAPITPIDANDAVLSALEAAEQRLYRVQSAVDVAHEHASRLKLTDAAAEHRDQQLERQERGEHEPDFPLFDNDLQQARDDRSRGRRRTR